ncbi:helix-turn-helix transcriptional regulator [Streptomyces sp. NPDC056362]|uniref:helix-turn-helix transcriptional regulator n=1 Tax=unclassified Streptomyces TaxID=2593676 RepID=UPI0035E163E7
MSRIGQLHDIADFPFPVTPGGPPGVEVTDLAGWRARVERLGRRAGAAVRPGFHLLVTVRSGTLDCDVDLTGCRMDAGSWLWLRPGQVVRLRGDAVEESREARVSVILFQPSFLDTATVASARLDRRAWRLPLTPPPGPREPITQTLDLLEDEYHQLRNLPLEVHVEVVRHLLAVLVLRLSHLPGGHRRQTAGDETFRRFQQAVEHDFTRLHQAEQYAAGLGYSVRTLTRASNAAVGRGAKAFIDDRLVLEAKRLLLHTDLLTATVGERLGFPSSTVFTRFFRKRTGETPAGFRTRAKALDAGGER